jgi:hypothetical protein
MIIFYLSAFCILFTHNKKHQPRPERPEPKPNKHNPRRLDVRVLCGCSFQCGFIKYENFPVFAGVEHC